jgi:inosose dehydratase
MSNSSVTVANAPISWGAFELTVGIHPSVPDPDTLLDLLVAAGYDGVDLGPVGYLGRDAELRSRLSSRGLGLAGGYIELPFSEPDRLQATIADLDELLDVFDEAAEVGERAPKPTLADGGAPHRRSSVGRSASDRSFGLDDTAWERWGSGANVVIDHCRRRGYEPTLHPEAGTYIEAEWEIERALEVSEFGLCLETGHQSVGGGDPLAVLERWGHRVNHVHVKDARRTVIDRVVAESMPVESIWSERAFCAIGEGDVPIDDILDRLVKTGYSGWVVVEQDIMPGPDDPDAAQRAQIANRSVLRAHGY